MNTKIATGILVIVFFCASCHRQCPAYPKDIMGVMPIEKAGQILCFVSRADTVRLNYGQVSLSQKYQQDYYCKCVCDASVQLIATLIGNDGEVRYSNNFSSFPDEELPENGVFTISIHKVFGLNILVESGLSKTTDTISNVENISGFISETGARYERVYKITTEYDDVLYLVRGIGLVQIDSRDGKIWSLVD